MDNVTVNKITHNNTYRIDELRELIATLEADIEGLVVDELRYDFTKDMMEKALIKARQDLRHLEHGEPL